MHIHQNIYLEELHEPEVVVGPFVKPTVAGSNAAVETRSDCGQVGKPIVVMRQVGKVPPSDNDAKSHVDFNVHSVSHRQQLIVRR